jgi:RNA polymerase sigma factor (sigma-70 family)
VSARSYQVVVLRWVEGRSVSEIAASLKITPEQVRYRHHRMMEKLRSLVARRKNRER